MMKSMMNDKLNSPRRKAGKKTIASAVLGRTIVMVFIVLAILLITAFCVVTEILSVEEKKYSQTVVNFYSDLVAYSADEGGYPLDSEHTEKMKFYGNYVSLWYNVDYTYMILPHIEEGTATIIDVSYANPTEEQKREINAILGKEIEYDFDRMEIEVYNGKRQCGHTVSQKFSNNEYITFVKTNNKLGEPLLAGIAVSYGEILTRIISAFVLLAIIMLVLTAGIVMAVYYQVLRRVQKPAEEISAHMEKFVREGFKNAEPMNEGSSKEFSMIAASFNSMSDSIEKYISDIKGLNSQKKHFIEEFDMASTLQKTILPKETLMLDDFYINAKMEAAKEVGGDLYDYCEVDDKHSMIVIADVSGKGLAASIFMAMTLALIRQCARFGLSPAKIMEETNESLVPRNERMLFVTAFIGLYNKETGLFTYSNAGHNLPYVLGRELVALDGGKGSMLGIFENEKYEECSVKLNMGDIIFLYTDGVTEAINANKEFYGTKKLEKTLMDYYTVGDNNIVEYVYNSIKDFSKGEPQYDDITMLALTTKKCVELRLNPEISEFSKIKQVILDTDLDHELQINLCVIAEEYFTNICNHAFCDDNTTQKEVVFYFEQSYKAELKFIDNGIQYDPTENVMQSADDYDFDIQLGGLGKFIASSIADDVNYEYRDNRNVLTITKYLTKNKIKGDCEHEY